MGIKQCFNTSDWIYHSISTLDGGCTIFEDPQYYSISKIAVDDDLTIGGPTTKLWLKLTCEVRHLTGLQPKRSQVFFLIGEVIVGDFIS